MPALYHVYSSRLIRPCTPRCHRAAVAAAAAAAHCQVVVAVPIQMHCSLGARARCNAMWERQWLRSVLLKNFHSVKIIVFLVDAVSACPSSPCLEAYWPDLHQALETTAARSLHLRHHGASGCGGCASHGLTALPHRRLARHAWATAASETGVGVVAKPAAQPRTIGRRGVCETGLRGWRSQSQSRSHSAGERSPCSASVTANHM